MAAGLYTRALSARRGGLERQQVAYVPKDVTRVTYKSHLQNKVREVKMGMAPLGKV